MATIFYRIKSNKWFLGEEYIENDFYLPTELSKSIGQMPVRLEGKKNEMN